MGVGTETMYGHIVTTLGVCGGKPRIEGHRIKVQHLAIEHERLGMSPDEICDAHPGLTLSQVHAALAYYYDHEDAIRADVEADEKFADEFKQQLPEQTR